MVLKAPDLHDERVYPMVYSLCYQTCQHHGMGGRMPHCGKCKSLPDYVNHLPEGLQMKITKLACCVLTSAWPPLGSGEGGGVEDKLLRSRVVGCCSLQPSDVRT